MKKMISKMSTFTLGLIVGVTFTGATAVGAATYLKATQSSVKIVVDGTQAKLSDSPLNVNGKLYLPVRDTANAMGYSVESVTSSQVSLKEGIAASSTTNSGSTGSNNSSSGTTTVTTPSNNNNNSTSSKKVNNLKETYSTDDKLDAEKIRTALNSGTLGVNDQDNDTGKTLLMFVIEENNYEAYKAIKRNALNVDIQDKQGNSALHIAILESNVFYFGELLDLKADATLKNKSGKRPIDLTEKNSSEQIMLKGYMM
ncbi:stalk domain-containing protein [Paenibacillus sp. USHLN196]|uniref:stalk domain-containing protein n=1 Tax=Paenibacillus sp. USHLN196 TaxID=3081291 RepID=UPI00301592E8